MAEPLPEEKKGIFYIGIDLGSFKSSIAAANGVREHIFSALGWAKDPVAKKLLGGRDIVYGEEAIRHRLALRFVRPFERGFLKYKNPEEAGTMSKEDIELHRKGARELIKHLVNLAKPPKGYLIYGVIGAPARASIYNKKELLEIAKEVFDAVMIVSEPFAVAYGLNKLEDVLIIDIGAGTVDLCRMQGTIPDETNQLTLTTAGDYVDEIFLKLTMKKYPQIQVSINMMREIKEKFSFVHDINDTCIVELPIAGKPTEVDLTEELKEACRSMVPPLVEAVQKLVSECDPEYQRRIRDNIILAGGGSQLRGLDRLLESALKEYGGARVFKVQEPVFAGANGALKLSMEMPEEYWQEVKEEAPAPAVNPETSAPRERRKKGE